MRTSPTLFVVTIDVEADDAWNHPERIELRNLLELPRFQTLCDRFGVIPTYLVSYETLTYERHLDFLGETHAAGKCEIGIHPHVWTVPPFASTEDKVDWRFIRGFQGQLSESLLRDKLENLHHAVIEKLECVPRCHRAGRWGLCLRTVKWLEEHHYYADTSVVPLMSSDSLGLDSEHSPDYTWASATPYRMSKDSLTRPGDLNLVEIPVTNVAKRANPAVLQMVRPLRRMKRGATRLKNLLHRMQLLPMEFRPYPNYPLGTLSRLAALALDKEWPVLNLMFHSSELCVGTSPYSSNLAATKRIWRHLEEVFIYVQEWGLNCVGLTAAASRLYPRENARNREAADRVLA